MRRSQLPLELVDHLFAQLGLRELSRVVAVSRFCHSRLPAAITACSLRLRLGGYAAANRLRSTSKLLAHLDTALPRLPRVIVVTWFGDFDWRVRLAALKALSLRGGGSGLRGLQAREEAAPTEPERRVRRGGGRLGRTESSAPEIEVGHQRPLRVLHLGIEGEVFVVRRERIGNVGGAVRRGE